MIKLGEIQKLYMTRKSQHGIYLSENPSNKTDDVLLPNNQVTNEILASKCAEVFIYRDSEDRLIATTTIPKITLGKFAVLDVVETTNIGAFLDWGLQKDLLLPFKEQKNPLNAGDSVLVQLYIDKSSRLCATTKIYEQLLTTSNYQKGDTVTGTVFDFNNKLGVFVAVDNKYLSLIPNGNFNKKPYIGEQITANVIEVRKDGKLNLTLNAPKVQQMDIDSDLIYNKLLDNDGFLPYHDKSDASIIKDEFSMSKNSFKRAIGILYKANKILIKSDGIYKA